jgi:hypothetical protein
MLYLEKGELKVNIPSKRVSIFDLQAVHNQVMNKTDSLKRAYKRDAALHVGPALLAASLKAAGPARSRVRAQSAAPWNSRLLVSGPKHGRARASTSPRPHCDWGRALQRRGGRRSPDPRSAPCQAEGHDQSQASRLGAFKGHGARPTTRGDLARGLDWIEGGPLRYLAAICWYIFGVSARKACW